MILNWYSKKWGLKDSTELWQAGRQAGRQEGRQAGRQAGRKAGI